MSVAQQAIAARKKMRHDPRFKNLSKKSTAARDRRRREQAETEAKIKARQAQKPKPKS